MNIPVSKVVVLGDRGRRRRSPAERREHGPSTGYGRPVSVPRPWPRRRPVLLLLLCAVALLNVGVSVLGVVQHGSSAIRWVITALWLGMAVTAWLGWRHQARHFDERTAVLEGEAAARDQPEAGPPAV